MAMLINGQPGDSISALDRGLAYGDGVYRTLEWCNGQPRLWRWQYARLAEDAARLCLPVPAEALLLEEMRQLTPGLERAVIKIVLTRGVGQRGYAIPEPCQPTRMISANPWDGYPATLAEHGVTVRWCQLRLASQPLLAGIKHLNRLENVLARSEWHDPAIREGLLCDQDGRVIEATMSNLYVLKDGVLLTPPLHQCGVRGALRDWLFDCAPVLGVALEEAELRAGDVLAADALLLSNSLMGIWPVAQLDARVWRDFTVAQRLRQYWLAETA